ncbi:High affinity immunoglobulin epsilon receptor subunit beta [Cricetulus griseus]|nr:High affinity immunoglobulin epsilon receptor subunit beta [Cricetulus griseus]
MSPEAQSQATQILNGIVILALGVFLGSLQYLSHQFRHVFFFTFYTGYPFWGAVFGLVSLMLILTLLELAVTISVSVMWCLGNISGSRKARGSLGANIVSSIASGIGIIILILNLSHNSTYLKYCKDLNEDDGCFVTAFITEMVSMMLFLTMLAFCSAVLHTIYRIGEAFKSNKVTDDRLYEELNVYSPIYSELEDKGETSSPVGS